jgi:hypothetical protein
MRRKVIMSTFLSFIVVASMSVGAFAASNLTVIKAYLNTGIKVSVDGAAWTPKDASGKVTSPITYKGTTYLPVRAVGDAFGVKVGWNAATRTVLLGESGKATKLSLIFPADRYPETAAHIQSAIASGESATCTIDREGADDNRNESLVGIPTKDGYDRDEWPMAMCAEGGTGADVMYVTSSDNRGSGAWVGNQLEDYSNGTRVLFVISRDITGSPTPTPKQSSDPTVSYANCTEVKAAGKAPIRIGDLGYSTKLDRDGDGIACEN